MQDSSFSFTDLEDRLAGPEGQDVRDDMLRQLAAINVRVQNHLLQGLPASDYPLWHATADALSAAGEALLNHPIGSSDVGRSTLPAPNSRRSP